jgi:bacillopeptidase F (M6 metalloprotease family)
MFALDPLTVGGGTDLTSPLVSVTSSSATVSFRNKYDTEKDWDGGVLDISIAGAPFQDILAAGGTFVQNGYNGALGPGTNNPIANRAAWTGDSRGFVTTVAQLPAAANGRIVQLRWRFGADNNTAKTGWTIDTFALTGAGFVSNFACSAGTEVSGRVVTAQGAGLRNASVAMTDADGNTRRVVTSSFGFYLFNNVRHGSYAIRVDSKRFRFASRPVSVTEDLTNIDFAAQE